MNFGAMSESRVVGIAWSWIAAAAVVALIVALVASWLVTRLLVRPIRGMTDAARSFTAGDRESRATRPGPGELGELAVAFNGMADAVVRSDRDRRNLTADVAHELRTPLAALQAGLEELRDGLAQPTPEGLAGLQDQSLRLGRVVADLAELSAVESAGLSMHLASVDLPHIFDRLWRGREAAQVTGSGIGLALVREIGSSHGGTVEAASPPGEGTTITVRLPVTHAPGMSVS